MELLNSFLNVSEGGLDADQVVGGDAAEARVVVDDLVLRHDECLVNRLSLQVDDGDARQLVSHHGVAHLAVEGEDAVIAVGVGFGGRHRRDEPPHVVEVEDVGDVALVDLASLRVSVALAARVRLDRSGG